MFEPTRISCAEINWVECWRWGTTPRIWPNKWNSSRSLRTATWKFWSWVAYSCRSEKFVSSAAAIHSWGKPEWIDLPACPRERNDGFYGAILMQVPSIYPIPPQMVNLWMRLYPNWRPKNTPKTTKCSVQFDREGRRCSTDFIQQISRQNELQQVAPSYLSDSSSFEADDIFKRHLVKSKQARSFAFTIVW